MKNLNKALHRGVHQLGLSLQDDQQQLLLDYLAFLDKWNHHYNLSAIRDMDQMLTHHILDSLAVAKYVSNHQCVLDIGTGAGLPGLVLAVCYPEHHFVLLDGNGKKIRFLVQAKHDLKINNIEPIQQRAENFQTEKCFDGIISRAVGTINDLIHCSKHLLCTGGHWYAMKGSYPQDELDGLTLPYEVVKLDVPSLVAERHLVILEEEKRG